MSERSALGVVIRRRRRELGWTQEELAERISTDDEYVRQSEISRIESGKIDLPRRDRLIRLAEVLDLPLGELLARSGWAGAERYFQPSPTVDTGVVESDTGDTNETSTPPIRLVATSSTESVTLGSPAGGLPSSARSYDPVALAEFRQALATLRKESDRLQRNRLAVLEMKRQFGQTTKLMVDSDDQDFVGYSNGAGG